MDALTPVFPALIIYHDNSIASFTSLEDWTHDVDQWFWSDSGDYLIDSRGHRFDQLCERASDGRPNGVPLWVFTKHVDDAHIASLVAGALGMEPEEDGLEKIHDPEERRRQLIARVIEFDAR